MKKQLKNEKQVFLRVMVEESRDSQKQVFLPFSNFQSRRIFALSITK